MTRRIKQAILAAGDIFLLYFSLYLALQVRHGLDAELSSFFELVLPFTFVYALWLVSFFTVGLYSMVSIWNIPKTLRKFVNASIVNVTITVFFFYFIPYFSVTPKTILFLDLIIFSLLFVGWRSLYSKVIRSVGTTSNLILVGSQEASFELARKIINFPELGYNLVALFNLGGAKIPGWLQDRGVLVGENLSQLKKLLRGREVNLVVVSNEVYSNIFGDLYSLIPTGVDFYNLSSFWEELDRSIPISEADEVWFLENLRGFKKRFYELRKRVIDVFFSVILGAFSLVMFPLITLAIKLDSKGPIFYRQMRVGKDGKIFEMVKFRTMVEDAEKDGVKWAQENDPRITKAGRILRATRLDELPQLINVLKGDMSFIGPRPERPEFVEKLERKIPHYSLRHLIRPGLSGWAQVNYPYGSSEEDAEKKLRYDLYYLSHRSLLLDGEIALKTIATMLSRKGR